MNPEKKPARYSIRRNRYGNNRLYRGTKSATTSWGDSVIADAAQSQIAGDGFGFASVNGGEFVAVKSYLFWSQIFKAVTANESVKIIAI